MQKKVSYLSYLTSPILFSVPSRLLSPNHFSPRVNSQDVPSLARETPSLFRSHFPTPKPHSPHTPPKYCTWHPPPLYYCFPFPHCGFSSCSCSRALHHLHHYFCTRCMHLASRVLFFLVIAGAHEKPPSLCLIGVPPRLV